MSKAKEVLSLLSERRYNWRKGLPKKVVKIMQEAVEEWFATNLEINWETIEKDMEDIIKEYPALKGYLGNLEEAMYDFEENN